MSFLVGAPPWPRHSPCFEAERGPEVVASEWPGHTYGATQGRDLLVPTQQEIPHEPPQRWTPLLPAGDPLAEPLGAGSAEVTGWGGMALCQV